MKSHKRHYLFIYFKALHSSSVNFNMLIVGTTTEGATLCDHFDPDHNLSQLGNVNIYLKRLDT